MRKVWYKASFQKFSCPKLQLHLNFEILPVCANHIQDVTWKYKIQQSGQGRGFNSVASSLLSALFLILLQVEGVHVEI